jgi:hypothetical protein
VYRSDQLSNMYPAPSSGDIRGHCGGRLSLHSLHAPGNSCTLQQGKQVPRTSIFPPKKGRAPT